MTICLFQGKGKKKNGHVSLEKSRGDGPGDSLPKRTTYLASEEQTLPTSRAQGQISESQLTHPAGAPARDTDWDTVNRGSSSQRFSDWLALRPQL